MVKIDVEYCGDLRCEATHGPSANRLWTDAPVDNGGQGRSFSPTDLVATALATCLGTVMGLYAKRAGVDLRGTRIEIEKEMSAQTPRRIARLAVRVTLPIPRSLDPKGFLEQAARGCPVHQSLHPEVAIPMTFVYADEAAGR